MDSMWLVWLGAALVAGLLELTSMSFVFVMLAGGALAAALVAAVGAGLPFQAIVFASTSAVLIFAVRPGVKRWAARNAPYVPTNVDALRGSRARTLSEVDHRGGTVKLAGETWSARTSDEGTVIPADQPVDVARIDGATAVVVPARRQDSPPPLSEAPWTEP